ncbi:MAG TPA: zf-HC2 domain-containing protein [Gemmatimonadales bacterium]|jgi:hypothetical protein
MTHVTEGDLVRLMDGECETEERSALERHVDGCAACDIQLRGLRESAAVVREALPWLDIELRSAPRLTQRRRALAAALVLVGVATAVSPVRAWIVEQGRALWSALGRPSQAAPLPPGPSVVARAGRSAGVSFVPQGNTFTVEVSSHQAAGSLALSFQARDTASATLAGDTEQESFLVLPSALRIATTPRSTATYGIVLPSRLRSVAVTIDGGTPVLIPVTTTGATWNIALTRGARPVRTDRP